MARDQHTAQDPTTKYPQPRFPKQQQPPGATGRIDPRPDHGEESYKGSGRLSGKATVITGADPGIGKAVAIAYAREGADVLVSYLDEEEGPRDTEKWVEDAGRKAVLVPGDVADPEHCRRIVQKAVDEFGRIDVLVNNAAHQMTRNSLEKIPDEEWDYTFATNISAMFHLCKAAVGHMHPGSAIIGSSSVNSDAPKPTLAPYAATKAAIANFSASLTQMLGERGIRVNSVASGPIWTPLIPSTMPPEQVESFGQAAPLGLPGPAGRMRPGLRVARLRRGQSYVSGARVAVTGASRSCKGTVRVDRHLLRLTAPFVCSRKMHRKV